MTAILHHSRAVFGAFIRAAREEIGLWLFPWSNIMSCNPNAASELVFVTLQAVGFQIMWTLRVMWWCGSCYHSFVLFTLSYFTSLNSVKLTAQCVISHFVTVLLKLRVETHIRSFARGCQHTHQPCLLHQLCDNYSEGDTFQRCRTHMQDDVCQIRETVSYSV